VLAISNVISIRAKRWKLGARTERHAFLSLQEDQVPAAALASASANNNNNNNNNYYYYYYYHYHPYYKQK